MKFLIVLSAALAAVTALPTDFGNAELRNSTRADERSIGFASFGGGTRGGAGGPVWTVWDAWALRDAIRGTDPRIIYVRGRIDLGVLFTASPGVVLNVGSWKSILGGDRNAEITGGGLKVRSTIQVIIRNLKFSNALSYAPGERPNGSGGIVNQVAGAYTEIDAVLCHGAQHVWIDHCEFSDDPWIANNIPNDRMRHDGLVDIKRGANWITVSHNIFRNHNRNILLGHNDNNAAQDNDKLKTTFVGNWFRGTTQRNPRVRFGEVHILNNLYTDIGAYGIGIGAAASVYVERNAFVNTRRSWAFAAGTPNPMGHLFPVNNHFVNSAFDTNIPNGVRWNPNNYYSYTPRGSMTVEAWVRSNAGTR